MRTLSSTLLAAQRSASAEPYVKITVSARIGGVPRLSWERLYTGSEGDYYSAATVPGDGSLVRARMDPATYHLHVQRVPAPGPSADFSTWTDLGEKSAFSGVALTSQGSTVLLFYVETNQRNIYMRESTDYGQTWGAPQFLHDPSAATGWLAADFDGQGTVTLFFVAATALSWMKRSGGVWTAPQQWTNSVASFSGIACHYQDDWDLLVCGTDTAGDARVWSCIFGDGVAQQVETWSPLRVIVHASSGASVAYRTPALSHSDVHRAFFVEKYTGTGAYARAYWTHSPSALTFADNGWREAVPFDWTGDFGPALALEATYVWLSTPNGVWRAARVPAQAEVTTDVLDVEALQGPRQGRLAVTLRNDHGAYDDAALPAALRLGAEVQVEWGHRTSAGLETSSAPLWWIEGWERRVEKGRALFILHATDGWGLLRHWRARRQLVWEAGQESILNILTELFTRVGFRLTVTTTSSIMTSLTPAFTVHPGEEVGRAVARLLDMAPDVLRFTSDGSGEVIYPQESDSSAYTYGPLHPIIEGRSTPTLAPVNWVQVYGQDVMAEELAWPDVANAYDRLLQVHDLNLATLADAQERAQGELRHTTLGTSLARITAPVNCGQELYDVVDVMDERLDLTGALFRVVGIATRFHRGGQQPTYVQDLTLSRP